MASRNKRRGFTLVELLITLAILALLAVVALPVAQVSVQRQKEQECQLLRQQICELEKLLSTYQNS